MADIRKQIEDGITQALESLGTKPRGVTFQDSKVSVGLGSAVEARHVAFALKSAGLKKVRTVKTYDGARIVHGTL